MARDGLGNGRDRQAEWWKEHLSDAEILARKLNDIQAAFEDVWTLRGGPSHAAVFVRAAHGEGCDLYFSPTAAALLPASPERQRSACLPPRAQEVRLLVGHQNTVELLGD